MTDTFFDPDQGGETDFDPDQGGSTDFDADTAAPEPEPEAPLGEPDDGDPSHDQGDIGEAGYEQSIGADEADG